MNIIVFDVPAESVGALTILKEFYNAAVACEDKKIKWTLIVGKPELESAENVEVVRLPFVKKSWLHRLYFDIFVAHKLVNKYEADRIFSLQNMMISGTSIFQTVYIHQSIPFSNIVFNFFEDPILWTYKNILSKGIYNTVKKANRLIVQTNWMKTACIEKCKVSADKIMVFSPSIDKNLLKKFNCKAKNFKVFFYPATFHSYKNHKVIIEAVEILKQKGIDNFKVIFTAKSDDNNDALKAEQRVKKLNLNIEFAGNFTIEEVFEEYSKSILIFPSLLETFGLPLLEARLSGAPIIASDMPFSREVLDGYENASFFNAYNPQELAVLMKRSLDGESYFQEDDKVNEIGKVSWNKIISLLTGNI